MDEVEYSRVIHPFYEISSLQEVGCQKLEQNHQG